MGFIGNLISKIGDVLGIKKKTATPSLGNVIVKPSEVSKLGQGTRYEVPETGETGVKGVSSTGKTAVSKTISDIIPSGNVQEELAKISTTAARENIPSTQVAGTTQQNVVTTPTQNQTVTPEGIPLTKVGREQLMAQAQRDGTININGKVYTAQELIRKFSSVPLPDSELALTPAENLQLVAGAMGAAAIPAVLSTASTALSALTAYFSTIGATASTSAGATTLASTVPEAVGLAPSTATTAGAIATNTVTTAAKIGFLASLTKSKVALGLLIGAPSFTTLLSAGTSGGEVRRSASSYIKDGGQLMLKLREAGMNEEADQIYNNMKDIEDDFQTVIPYIPWIGKTIETNKIQGFVDDLTYYNNEYETMQLKEAEQAAIDERTYKEQQLQEQRRYEEERLAEQRAYEEEQAAKKLEAEQEATLASSMTELTSGSSTLNFGILNAGGDIEYVDINKASQYYFGKAYEELTFAQRRLLTLSKGTA